MWQLGLMKEKNGTAANDLETAGSDFDSNAPGFLSQDPGSAFFELLPPEAEADSRPIPAWEAQVGACYELVVTNRSLCRCRLGEVLRVHAMFGKMPVVSLERKRERTDAGASSLLLTFGLQLSYALVQRS